MVLGFAVLLMVWLAVTRSIHVSSLVSGALGAMLVVLFWHNVMPNPETSAYRVLRHPFRFARFLATLGYRFVLSTLHTVWMILRGGEEGHIVALPIRVQDPFAQFLLLNAITLTPSTISLLTEDDFLYIHWLRPRGQQGDWREIKESIEACLVDLFEPTTRGDHVRD